MMIKNIIYEDFVNYKKPAMYIAFPKCSFKCEKECGLQVCQNSKLSNIPNIDINVDDIVEKYIDNKITSSIVLGGMEPFDSFNDLMELIEKLRKKTNDDIVIYTGYTKQELENGYFYNGGYNSITRKGSYIILKTFSNIIIKFGRFIPNQDKHYDNVLGVWLASDNQYAERIS